MATIFRTACHRCGAMLADSPDVPCPSCARLRGWPARDHWRRVARATSREPRPPRNRLVEGLLVAAIAGVLLALILAPSVPGHAPRHGASPHATATQASAVPPPAGDQIEAITLARSGTGTTSPGYEVTIRPDGSVRYEGLYNVPRMGAHIGRADPRAFRRLAALVERSGFWAAPESYPHAPDVASARLEVKAGSRTKAVRDPAGSDAPAELWGLEMAIDGIVAGIQDWTPEAAAAAPAPVTGERAIAIARDYYRANFKVDVARYKSSVEKDGAMWHVRLVGEPPTPGDHCSLFVDATGRVVRFVGGE